MQPAPLDTKTRVKSILGGSAGNLVEWYDWYVYAAFTLYFAHAFFPQGSQTAQLLQKDVRNFAVKLAYATHWRMDYGGIF